MIEMYTYIDKMCKVVLLFYHLYSAAENGKLRLGSSHTCTRSANFIKFKEDDKRRRNGPTIPLK